MAATLLLAIACTEPLRGQPAATLALSLVDTGRFVVLCTAGIRCACHLSASRRAVAALHPRAAAGLWLAGLALLLSPGPTVYRYYDLTWGLGATLVLALAIGSTRAARALSARGPVWLGRVSYSLYLIHLPLLAGLVQLADGRLPLPLVVATSVLLSLLGAEAMHRTVEIPAMRLGRRLAARIGTARHPAPVIWPGLGGTRP